MKKTFIYYLWLVCLIFIYLFFSYRNDCLVKDIDRRVDKFDQMKLLDNYGKVTLIQLEERKDRLEREILLTFHENDIKDIAYEKYLNIDSNNGSIKELISKISDLELEKDNKITEHTILNLSYQHMVNNKTSTIGQNIKNSYYIENFPLIYQYPNYPTGCEAVALTMLLRYHGINVSPDDVIKLLKQGDLPHEEDGVIYGGNPELEFIGSPYSYDSYGVYNTPIGNVAAQLSSSVVVQSDFPFSEVQALIREGKPVVVWTSMNLALPYLSSRWIYKPTGEVIWWKAQEHAVVAIGYNEDSIIIADPLRGEIRYQDRNTFESRYNYYGKRAVYLW